MKSFDSTERAQWSSFYSYVLVTTGAVVGLGNIFYFPFLVSKFGGLFVLFYIICELLISVPLLLSELIIGRRGKQNPVGAISLIAMEADASTNWRFIGWLCFIILFLTLAFYTVMVSYPVGYFFESLRMLSSHATMFDLTHSEPLLTSHFLSLEVCFLLFLGLTMVVILRGINRGLEGISRITVPTYFLLLFAVAVYVSFQGYLGAAVEYLFQIPGDQPIFPILLAALIFAFFKLNVGMGSMIVYGSYLPYSVPLGKSTGVIIGLDALASLLSYIIICPLLLQSNSLDIASNLTHQNIVMIFSSVPYGIVLASVFFLAAVVAAWTATIALAESAAVILIERFQMSRRKAVAILTAFVIFIGTIIVLSDIYWSDILLFSQWTVAGFIQNFATDMATPISAFLISIFCGWAVARTITFDELGFSAALYNVWRFLVRYVAPVFIAVIFLLIGFN
jgi:NSS family neurotransmitter:Na+ symporter